MAPLRPEDNGDASEEATGLGGATTLHRLHTAALKESSCRDSRYAVVHFARRHGLLQQALTGMAKTHCPLTLFNVAQWHLSWEAEDLRPLPPDEFANALSEVIAAMHPTVRRQLLWVSVMPHPIPWGNHDRCPPMEWRYPHMLARYHAASMSVMKRWGVPTADIFDVLFDVVDLSYDGAHYERFFVRGAYPLLAKALLEHPNQAKQKERTR